MSNRTVGYFIQQVNSSKRLTPQEEVVLTLRLKRRKLRQIGRKFKVTEGRIRQIENSALLKLESKVCQERLI